MVKSKNGLLSREGQLVYLNSCLEKYTADGCRYFLAKNQSGMGPAIQEHAGVVDRYFCRIPEEMEE